MEGRASSGIAAIYWCSFHKLIGKGVLHLAFLRNPADPPLTGGGGVGVTFLWRIFDLHKLIGKGVALLTFLRYLRDPPLTDGSSPRMAFLRDVVGSHN